MQSCRTDFLFTTIAVWMFALASVSLSDSTEVYFPKCQLTVKMGYHKQENITISEIAVFEKDPCNIPKN